jgi:hypothetical protein
MGLLSIIAVAFFIYRSHKERLFGRRSSSCCDLNHVRYSPSSDGLANFVDDGMDVSVNGGSTSASAPLQHEHERGQGRYAQTHTNTDDIVTVEFTHNPALFSSASGVKGGAVHRTHRGDRIQDRTQATTHGNQGWERDSAKSSDKDDETRDVHSAFL